MSSIEIVLALLLCSIPLTLAARRIGLPDPVALVLGGAALAFVPGLPLVAISPGAIFTIVLPPILYQAALHIPWRDFRRDLKTILILAIGLVLATMLAVGWVAHLLIPALSLPAALVLGAIVSPTDPTAATAIMGRLGAPRRIVLLVESESIVNDATGLVLFTLAVAAVAGGAFSPILAGVRFVYISAAGVAVGLVLAWVSLLVHRLLRDTLLETMWALLLPFAAYLLADAVKASGILAVLAAGLLRGWHAPTQLAAETRLVGMAIWDVVAFVLNSLVFVLIGLQMRAVVTGLPGHSLAELLAVGAAVSAAVIAVRILWILPLRWLGDRVRRRTGPPWQWAAIVSWSGMRGILSLAAALAVPQELQSGAPFPERDLIIFLTFMVILTTLLLQAATLAPLIRWLGIDPELATRRQERLARREATLTALAVLDRLAAEPGFGPASVASLQGLFAQRLTEDESPDPNPALEREIWRRIIAAQRDRLLALGRDHRIDDDVVRSVLAELDHQEASQG